MNKRLHAEFGIILMVGLSFFCVFYRSPAWADAPAPNSPIVEFYNDKLLSEAQKDIMQMPRHELDMLTDALAACDAAGLMEGDVARQPCDIAAARYRIAYSGGRAIDRLFIDTRLIERQISLTSKNLKPNDPSLAQMSKNVTRLVDITSKLSLAISLRNAMQDGK